MRSTLAWLSFVAAVLVAAPVRAQFATAATPARLPVVSSDVERQLAQVDALVAAEAWDEAVDAMLRLVDEADTSQLVVVTPHHHIPLAEACGLRIARWPQAGLETYRNRVDATARAEYEAALAARSPTQLARVARDYFASSYGDDALWALGTLALEQGHYAEARRAWTRLFPQMVAPDGRPWGVALAGADLSQPQVWQRVEPHFAAPAEEVLQQGYPDTDIARADILARLAMVSIREQSLPRAEVEVALLERLYPDAEGIVAGRTARLAEALATTLEAARQWPQPQLSADWPTFAGSYERTTPSPPLGDLRGVVWTLAANEPAAPDFNDRRAVGRHVPTPVTSPLEVVGEENRLVLLNGSRLLALQTATGEPLFGEQGLIFEEESLWPPTGLGRVQVERDPQVELLLRQRMQFQLQGRIVLNRARWMAPMAPAERGRMVTLSGKSVYAVIAPGGDALARGVRGSTRHLMGFDLDREGKLVLEIKPESPTWQFSGPPIIRGDHLYVAMREGETGQKLYVAKFSRHSGRMLWRQLVASVSGSSVAYHEDLLTLAGETLYFNTNAGAVVAIDTASGQIEWAHLYEQWSSSDPRTLEQRPQRAASPVLFARGVVVCLPSDAIGPFALDAASGRPLWFDRDAHDTTDLVACADGLLVSTGQRLLVTRLLTGKRYFAWPDTKAAGIQGKGRGAVAGREIFWPTNRGLYAFHLVTGQPSRRPLSLESLGESEVQVVPQPPYLVVSSGNKLVVYGPEGSPPTLPESNEGPELSAVPAALQGPSKVP